MPRTYPEIHLGDGVYASFDGYQVWLAVNHHTNKVVALEAGVARQLVAYFDTIREINSQPEPTEN